MDVHGNSEMLERRMKEGAKTAVWPEADEDFEIKVSVDPSFPGSFAKNSFGGDCSGIGPRSRTNRWREVWGWRDQFSNFGLTAAVDP
jgi:hypothetical protein